MKIKAIIYADEQSCAGEHLEFRAWLTLNEYAWTAEPRPPHAEGDEDNEAWEQFCNSPDRGNK